MGNQCRSTTDKATSMRKRIKHLAFGLVIVSVISGCMLVQTYRSLKNESR